MLVRGVHGILSMNTLMPRTWHILIMIGLILIKPESTLHATDIHHIVIIITRNTLYSHYINFI